MLHLAASNVNPHLPASISILPAKARMSKEGSLTLESSFGQVLKRGRGEEGRDCVSVFGADETPQVWAPLNGQTEGTLRTSRGCVNWRMRISGRSRRLGDKRFLSTGSVVAAVALSSSFPGHRLRHTGEFRRRCVLPGALLRGAQRAGCRGRGGRGARSWARVNLRTWHLPHGKSAGRRTEGHRRRRPLFPERPEAEHAPAGRPRRGESGWAGEGGEGRGGREGGEGRGASPRRGRALARAAGIARRRCGNVRHVGHGAGSGSGGRAADLVCGSGRGRQGAVFGRGGRPCCGRGQ